MKSSKIVFMIISVILLIFIIQQKGVIKKQQAEISILKTQQVNYENQFQLLTQQKAEFESRFNETLNHLRQITQTKQTLDTELESAKTLINNLEDEKKAFSANLQKINNVPANTTIPSSQEVATLRGEIKYLNKSITKTTKETPVILLKEAATGNLISNVKVSINGSKYKIEKLPLGKYEILVVVNPIATKNQNLPADLRGGSQVEILKSGKTVEQNITLQ